LSSASAVGFGSAGGYTPPRPRYGTRISKVFGSASGLEDLGERFGDDVYEAEIRYLMAEEFARSAEDVLWRRSKLGLHLPRKRRRG
jgi:glycerol-3-phosphate dehydrogenase